MPATQLVILCALTEGPANAYHIVKRIKQQAQGNPNLIPKNIHANGGGLYVLFNKGLIGITTYPPDDRKTYYLTPKGIEVMEQEVANLRTLRSMCINALWQYQHRNANQPSTSTRAE